MRFARYASGEGEAELLAVVVGDELRALSPTTRLVDLLARGPEALRAAGEAAEREPFEVEALESARLLAPIETPPSLRDFYAFEGHVKAGRAWRGLEMDPDWYELPIFYFSNPTAVRGPGNAPMAPGTGQWDFELEVAAIIGPAGKNLDPDGGHAAIAGYCVMNDFSARDLQKREMALSLGPVKGKDTVTALGPFLVTPDELEPRRSGKAFDLEMTARVNGREVSRASLADLHWSFGEMISYASRGTAMQCGDVVGSGTCPTGCILELSRGGQDPDVPWLAVGDVVELEVELLGTLRNVVVDADLEVIRPPLR